MYADCVLALSLGKCFFFLAFLHWQMGFDIVPWEQIIAGGVSMVTANDTFTLHCLFATSGVEHLICWHWLVQRAK